VNFRNAAKSALGPKGLDPEASQTLVANTRAQYPGWPLEMLIPVNAAAIAKEFSTMPAN
jgi:hypothetical protein